MEWNGMEWGPEIQNAGPGAPTGTGGQALPFPFPFPFPNLSALARPELSPEATTIVHHHYFFVRGSVNDTGIKGAYLIFLEVVDADGAEMEKLLPPSPGSFLLLLVVVVAPLWRVWVEEK